MSDTVEHDLSRLLVDLHTEGDYLVMDFAGSDFSRLVVQELAETSIKVGKDHAQMLFDRCIATWDKTYDRKKFAGDLDRIVKKGVKKLSKKRVGRLKELRKVAATIRSLQYVFDRQHKSPAAWKCFVRDFGRLNDAISAGSNRKARKIAQDLSDFNHPRKLKAVFKSFRPAPAREVADFFEHEIRQIVGYLHHESLPSEEFHELRKALKNFMNVLRIVDDSADDNGKTTHLKNYLLAINDAFGTINDIIVTLELKKEIDADRVKIRLVPEMRLGVANAVSVIRFS